jgi:hypothetical protein
MKAVDLFEMLTPQERKQFLALLPRESPCQRSGHKFKAIGREYRWFRPPAVKCLCTACGEIVWR